MFYRHRCGIKVFLNWSKRLINLEPKKSVITYYLIKRKIAWKQFLSWRFLAPPDLYRAGIRHGQYSTWVTHNIVHQAFIDSSGTGNHDCVAAPHGARALYCCLAKGDHDNPFSAVRQTDGETDGHFPAHNPSTLQLLLTAVFQNPIIITSRIHQEPRKYFPLLHERMYRIPFQRLKEWSPIRH